MVLFCILLILAKSDYLGIIMKMYLARLTEIKPENEFYNSLWQTRNIIF
jgi:hypothetical protein